MKMMYLKVAETLREVGPSQAKPTDYLNFYCLGTKETIKPGEFKLAQPSDNNSKHVSELMPKLFSFAESYQLKKHGLCISGVLIDLFYVTSCNITFYLHQIF